MLFLITELGLMANLRKSFVSNVLFDLQFLLVGTYIRTLHLQYPLGVADFCYPLFLKSCATPKKWGSLRAFNGSAQLSSKASLFSPSPLLQKLASWRTF